MHARPHVVFSYLFFSPCPWFTRCEHTDADIKCGICNDSILVQTKIGCSVAVVPIRCCLPRSTVDTGDTGKNASDAAAREGGDGGPGGNQRDIIIAFPPLSLKRGNYFMATCRRVKAVWRRQRLDCVPHKGFRRDLDVAHSATQRGCDRQL